MKKRVKIDFHTHLFEATDYRPLSKELVAEVIGILRERGLDGIGVTEHFDKDFGFKFQRIVEEDFNGAILVFPGWEIDARADNHNYQVTELYLPEKRMFRTYCHPGYPSADIVLDNVQGIELNNALHDWHMNKERIQEVARKHDLMTFSVSDAHRVQDVGRYHTELDLEDLYSLAIPYR